MIPVPAVVANPSLTRGPAMENKKIKCPHPSCSFEAGTDAELLEHWKVHQPFYDGEGLGTLTLREMPALEEKKINFVLPPHLDFLRAAGASSLRSLLGDADSALEQYSKENTRKLLEEGQFEKALELKRKPSPVEIKNRIIELREAYPELSASLVEAEEALIKDRRQYEKECKLQDEIIKRVSQKLGEAAVDLFSKALIWRLVREKAMPLDKLAEYVVQHVEELSSKLPSLDTKMRGRVDVVYGGKDCPICHGTLGHCPDCHDSGRKTRCLRGSEVFEEAQWNSQLREYLKQQGIKEDTLRFSGLLRLPSFDLRQPEVSITGPCPTCNGSGKHCSCTYEVTFHIPPKARAGMILKGEGSTSGKPFYARLGG